MHYIMLPSELVGFTNRTTEIVKTVSNREMYLLHGELKASAGDSLCPQCGSFMHIHNRCEVNLRHLCFGHKLSCLRFTKLRYYCPRCGHSHMQDVPFQAKGHRISCELLNYTRDLLAYGFTNKQVAYLTGLGKNTVKDIDLKRLKEKYTVDGERLIQPERQARYLGIDEFGLYLHGMKSTDEAVVQHFYQTFTSHVTEYPIHTDAGDLPICCSLGMAVYNKDTTNLFELIEFADFAMYHAKRSGKNSYCVFDKKTYEAEKNEESNMTLI